MLLSLQYFAFLPYNCLRDCLQVVQEGAALAPGWTEALFHELLDQEASPASGAALHHAADIMSMYDTAKARHCMAGMQQSISGTADMLEQRHAH